MRNSIFVVHQIERALAYAYAALDDAAPDSAMKARRHAEELWPRISTLKPRAVPIGDAHRLVDLLGQLRAVMTLLDRKLGVAQTAAN